MGKEGEKKNKLKDLGILKKKKLEKQKNSSEGPSRGVEAASADYTIQRKKKAVVKGAGPSPEITGRVTRNSKVEKEKTSLRRKCIRKEEGGNKEGTFGGIRVLSRNDATLSERQTALIPLKGGPNKVQGGKRSLGAIIWRPIA